MGEFCKSRGVSGTGLGGLGGLGGIGGMGGTGLWLRVFESFSFSSFFFLLVYLFLGLVRGGDRHLNGHLFSFFFLPPWCLVSSSLNINSSARTPRWRFPSVYMGQWKLIGNCGFRGVLISVWRLGLSFLDSYYLVAGSAFFYFHESGWCFNSTLRRRHCISLGSELRRHDG